MRSFLLGSVALVAVLGLAGCAADSESEGGKAGNIPLSANGPAAVGTPEQSEERIAKTDTHYPSVGGEGGFSCRTGAFCDAFDSSAYVNNWSSAVTTNDGAIAQLDDSASVGVGSLRLTTRDKDSTAFLLRESAVVGESWSGVLSFAVRLPSMPTGYVGGPELTVKTPAGPVYVRVFVSPEGIFLEQNGSASCSAERCVPTRTLLSTVFPTHWYNVTVAFEVNDRNSAPYGRVETSVNGGSVYSNDLNVPLSQGQVFLKAGITQGEAGADSTLDLDNVSLLVH